MPGRHDLRGHDPYVVLGIASDGDFAAIKKAYYRRVKECHPDLFAGAAEKEEEFKLLAAAFDVLSDPDQRRRYDQQHGFGPLVTVVAETVTASVMDTAADDLLEELIVGNVLPPGTGIATLLLDLQRTEVFVTFREGKTYFAAGRHAAALPFLRQAVNCSPNNILYRIYLARTCCQMAQWREAERHYRMALSLGERRIPPQRLDAVRREAEALARHCHPWWQKVRGLFAEPPRGRDFYDPEGEMVDEANRAIARLLRERQVKASEASKPPPPPLRLNR